VLSQFASWLGLGVILAALKRTGGEQRVLLFPRCRGVMSSILLMSGNCDPPSTVTQCLVVTQSNPVTVPSNVRVLFLQGVQ